MRDRYRLAGLENHELLATLSALVQREHELLSDFLAHLANRFEPLRNTRRGGIPGGVELDERRLYLDLGFNSLFAYCTEALGRRKSSAGRRIAAARVCRKFPDAFALTARGELDLSVSCELNRYLNSENATELFEACSGKSYEVTLELLAVRFPKPDLRDSIRRLPVRSAEFVPNIGPAPSAVTDAGSPKRPATLAVPDSVNGQDLPAISLAAPNRSVPVRRALEPLSAGRFGVRFTADAEFCELLEEVRALASHREPSGDHLSLMKRALQAYRRELQKERFGVGRRPRRARSKPMEDAEPARRSRHAVRAYTSRATAVTGTPTGRSECRDRP